MDNKTSHRPTIICHMVASIDGRIDCAMVDHISGDEYYTTLEQLDCPSALCGRVTMEHYHAESQPFAAKDTTPIGKHSFYIAEKADGYTVSVDTKGTLTWTSNRVDGKPLLCVVSEQASKEYLEYLQSKNISWISCGKDKIDLPMAMEILGKEFDVKRLALLGGGIINGGFLEAGLIDEVSLLLAPGIDGRNGRVTLFDGIANTPRNPFELHLKKVQQFPNEVLWIRYSVI